MMNPSLVWGFVVSDYEYLFSPVMVLIGVSLSGMLLLLSVNYESAFL